MINNKQFPKYDSAESEEMGFARLRALNLSPEEERKMYLDMVQENIERWSRLLGAKPVCNIAKKSVEKVIVDNSIGWSWD